MQNDISTNIMTNLWTYLIGGGGIISIIIALVYLGRKFQVLDTLYESFKKFTENFDKLGDKVNDIGNRVSKIEGKLFGVATASSPIRLTPLGMEILQDSGILNIAKGRKEDLMKKIREKSPKTAYDVQEITKILFDNLQLIPSEETILKNYAFQKGITLKDILYTGAIYFRDIALEELGFKIEDLDKIPQ